MICVLNESETCNSKIMPPKKIKLDGKQQTLSGFLLQKPNLGAVAASTGDTGKSKRKLLLELTIQVENECEIN